MINIRKQTLEKNFNYIVHLADIQIRLTKRHDEYREVFGRLFDSIKKTPENTIICVVGDVVHNKLDLSPECVQLTKEFLVGLADLRFTILTAGNHDTNLTNKNRLDSLSPIVEAINHPNLAYLKESGLYAFGDICFNNYSVFDDETKYIKGKDIPSIYRNEYRHFICLFHGTVDGSVSEMGFKLVNKNITISTFDNHDAVLLGDIHKVQTLQERENNKPTIHYPGSLIQQNHGEDLEGHGYTIWELNTHRYKHISIPNDYGYFTVKVDKGQITSDLTNIPKKARIRLSCYESLPTETKAVLKELGKITEFVEPATYTREDIKDGEKRSSTLAENLVQGDLTNRDHQIKLITEYLVNKAGIKDEDLIKEVIRINDETNSEIKTDDIAKNIRWNPVRFEWENLFSFGENNVIDFTKAKDVMGLFATNAAGKSSVFSALSWCIFDKCERDFKANNIINDQKMSCRATIEVEIGGIHYFIERVGRMDKKGAIKVGVKFWRTLDGKEENLTGIERSDTNNVIRSYMGSYEDFIITNLSVQRPGKYQTSFIDLGDSGRKDLLAQFLGLNIFDKLHEVANEKLNGIVASLKVYKNEDYESNLKLATDSLQQTTLALESENKKLTEIVEKKEKLQQTIEEESKKYIKVDGCSYSSIDPINVLIADYNKTITHNQNELNAIIKEKNQCNSRIVDIGEMIKVLESKDISNRYIQLQSFIKSKNDLSIPLSKKITEAKSFKEKVERAKGYEFNPTCEFCLINAKDVITEGKNAEKELERYKEEIGKLMFDQQVFSDKIQGLSEVDGLYQRYNSLLKERSSLQEKCLDWEKKSNEVNKKIDRTKESLRDVEGQLDAFNKNKEAIENNTKVNQIVFSIKKEVSDLNVEYNKQFNRVQTLYGNKAVYEMNIGKLTQSIEQIKKVEKSYKAYDLYTQSVCRDGIPYEVIASAVPHIENEVNSILSQIVEFHAKFDVDGKNIVPYIVKEDRHWLMSLTSGMEYFILSIAIRVALTNLSNLPRSNFLIIDEGFGVLDAENLSSMHTLFHFLKTNFDFVIIVSHLPTLRDMVDSQIEIKKENGFSKVNFI